MPSASASVSAGVAYAPYVSATTAADTDTAGDPDTYNLAFVVADGQECTPLWGGTTAVGSGAVASRIRELTHAGGDIRVSFGGAAGTELALACDSAEELAEAYAEVLDATGASKADLDIKGDALTDSASVALRAEAVASLQRERHLEVSYTLPVMPDGLDEDGLAVIEAANNHDVQLSHVNIMAMNYGSSYDGDMGDYAKESATAAHDQLMDVLGLTDAAAWKGLAVTSMLGVNDIEEETFTLEDAALLRDFAEEKGIGWLSVWASFRDRECEGGAKATVDDSCSGVEQEAGAFARALAG
ncbi:chitinase [Streptomyces sp. GC420]|uniref:chitinase n=1 Tax=Streptomyces sp. GC420 TaxID=2697568 RepID=UPI0014150967|nr:chitinase [Streptomyces sp. GC420]NBM15435.1 hydrolase [Streptomyces sp. GC420]